MRPGQQNKRGRGRGGSNNGGGNNFNRKGGNPLTRSYDSSGPDVKIRGTAQHIAEKYAALARDAQSSGDRVIAENYLQHAEHYNRIIFAAQAQMQERVQRDDFQDRDGDDADGNNIDDDAVQQRQPSNEAQQQRREHQQRDNQSRDNQPRENQPRENQRAQQPRRENAPIDAAPVNDGTGPQPVIEGIPAEVSVEEEAQGAAATERQPRRRATARPRRPRRGEEASADADAPDSASEMAVAETE